MRKAKNVEDTENFIKARPQYEGKDPLAGGERLHNLSNNEDASHYAVDQPELTISRKAKKRASQAETTPFFKPYTPPHKVKNSSKLEQDEVARGRKE